MLQWQVSRKHCHRGIESGQRLCAGFGFENIALVVRELQQLHAACFSRALSLCADITRLQFPSLGDARFQVCTVVRACKYRNTPSRKHMYITLRCSSPGLTACTAFEANHPVVSCSPQGIHFQSLLSGIGFGQRPPPLLQLLQPHVPITVWSL